jgi:hypothetical protein
MCEPSYETALLVATQRHKLAVAQVKANAFLTPAERREAFAKADADYVAARAGGQDVLAAREHAGRGGRAARSGR